MRWRTTALGMSGTAILAVTVLAGCAGQGSGGGAAADTTGMVRTPTGQMAVRPGPALNSLAKQYQDLYNKHDYQAVANLYAADATEMPPDTDAVHGRDEILKLLQRDSAMAPQVEIDQNASGGAGEFAWGTGTVKNTFTVNGQQVSFTGKYVVLGTNTDQGWKIETLIYNNDRPIQLPPAAGRRTR